MLLKTDIATAEVTEYKYNVKLSLCLIKHHIIKMYMGVDI
jgi:hypothetical protein